jgi:hypothetical protein
MMEATKQAEDLFKTWTEAQTRMWNDWLKALQGVGQPQFSQVWERTVDAWDQSIQKTLDEQMDWTRRWSESFTTSKGTSKEMVDWAKQGQDMLIRWIETQKLLWTNWFGIVKKLDPSEMGGNWERQGPKFMQVLEETVRRTLDAQKEWTKRQNTQW